MTGDYFQLDFGTEICYLFALGAIKISFCFFYLKVFPGKKFRFLSWCLIAVLVTETIEETLVTIFQCSPVQKVWDARDSIQGSCLQLLNFFYISFGIRLATDIALFALSIPNLLRLQMSLGKRVGLLFMFGLGILYAKPPNNTNQHHQLCDIHRNPQQPPRNKPIQQRLQSRTRS